MFSDTDTPSDLIPAATILLLRSGGSGLEVLMLRRNRALKAFGGAWVFPGGRVDAEDGPDLDIFERSKIAAIRETAEETGLDISGSEITALSVWIPPKAEIRRFSTWFFIAEAPDGPVKIDEGEIHEYRWVNPAEILAQVPHRDFPIMPPTYISLHRLLDYSTPDLAIAEISKAPNEYFETRFKKLETSFVTCWEGDTAYESLDFDQDGPRRRLYAGKSEWQYLTDF